MNAPSNIRHRAPRAVGIAVVGLAASLSLATGAHASPAPDTPNARVAESLPHVTPNARVAEWLMDRRLAKAHNVNATVAQYFHR